MQNYRAAPHTQNRFRTLLRDQLREWKRQSKQAKKKNKKKQKEKLSTRDIEDLMGIHGPRYERRRGALRQK